MEDLHDRCLCLRSPPGAARCDSRESREDRLDGGDAAPLLSALADWRSRVYVIEQLKDGLYAASVVADSKTLSANKVLPGASENWRSRPGFYAKAVREVGKIYDKYHKGGNVISNMLVHEPFLVKLKEKSTKVF